MVLPPLFQTSTTWAADPAEAPSVTLKFAFDGAPWRDVIGWLADESGLALHIGDIPPGSFTYRDPTKFTVEQAIDRVNLFLLPEGHTLVRSGQLLSVLNLADPRSRKQLDAMARWVSRDELAELTPQDVVKCLFTLADLDAADAVDELASLQLMTPPSVLNQTNQLLITDTVAKLRGVDAILQSFAPDAMDNGTIIRGFQLRHVDAEDVLTVARPHLGLATGEMIGIDVSLSSDLLGKNIFVTGVEDKVKLVENLIATIDVPDLIDEADAGEAILKSHRVEGGNVQMAYDVLQTLLAGRTVRLSMDPAADAVVALATPEIQAEIEATIDQLRADGPSFAVIQLQRIEPVFAISLINEMLDLNSISPAPSDSRRRDDRIASVAEPPKIDADLGGRRLFVRAKPDQLRQIREIIEQIDAPERAEPASSVTVVPLRGRRAESTLQAAVRLWNGENPVVLHRGDPAVNPREIVPSETGRSEMGRSETGRSETGRSETGRSATDPADTVAPAVDHSHPSQTDANVTTGRPAGPMQMGPLQGTRVLTSRQSASRSPPVHCRWTPLGLALQSDDADALDSFASHLRLVAGPMESLPPPPTVFYLKFTSAVDVVGILAQLLDGGEDARAATSGSLVSGSTATLSAFSSLGSLVTSTDGTLTLTTGTMTVVADSRLNRLIVQGADDEIETLGEYLRIIDQAEGIVDVRFRGQTRVFDLLHTRAADVAQVVRDAFAEQLASAKATSPGRDSGAGDSDRIPSGLAALPFAKALLGGRDEKSRGDSDRDAKPSGAQIKDLEPKMTLAVHEPGNSLIITAPESLLKNVEQLIRIIDQRAEETIQVIRPADESVQRTLQILFGDNASGAPSRQSSPSKKTSNRSSSRSPSK